MIDMNLKEAIEQILPHYERAVIEMPKEGHYKWFYDREIEFGLCRFSVCEYDVSILNGTSPQGINYLWNGRPKSHYTYEENLKQIQNRVDWMREYLSKN